MFYIGKFQNIEIAFTKQQVFQENGALFIKNAQKRSESNKELPRAILLNKINLSEEDQKEITDAFTKKTKEKQQRKSIIY